MNILCLATGRMTRPGHQPRGRQRSSFDDARVNKRLNHLLVASRVITTAITITANTGLRVSGSIMLH